MAGNKVGSLKIAAKRIGISIDEYMSHIDAGEKWCHKGNHWKILTEFATDKTRGDELKAVCRECDYTRITSGPGRNERREKRLKGLAYCRGCKDWLPVDNVRQGLCRIHINEESRDRYATDSNYRQERRQHAHSRKRGVEAIPPIGQTYILDAFEGKCAYCSSIATTWDHVIPVSRGGETAPYNIVPACGTCNSSKGNREVEEWVFSHPHTSLSQEFFDRIDLEWC